MVQNRAKNEQLRKQFAANAQAVWGDRSVKELSEMSGVDYTLCRRWLKKGVSHIAKGKRGGGRNNEDELLKFALALGFGSPHDLWRSHEEPDRYTENRDVFFSRFGRLVNNLLDCGIEDVTVVRIVRDRLLAGDSILKIRQEEITSRAKKLGKSKRSKPLHQIAASHAKTSGGD